MINRKNKIVLNTILSLVFITLVIKVFLNLDLEIDRVGYLIFVDGFRNDYLTLFFKIVTFLGSASFIVIVLIFMLIFFKNIYVKKIIFFNVIVITVINQSLKFLFGRVRPIGYKLAEASGYSFPSGHSMVSMAFYGLLIYLIYKYVKNNRIKWILIIVIAVLIITIGISRIYLGVHYTSDVIAGSTFSSLYLLNVLPYYNLYIEKGYISHR